MIKTENAHDRELLEGILEADHQRIKRIYDLALPSVISWVKENNGEETDARDVFQEALIALFRRLEKGDFILTCSLKSFLRIMCRNLWLARVRDKRKIQLTSIEGLEGIEPDEDLNDQLEQSEKRQLFFKHFDALEEKCRRILQWFFENISLREIAEKLGSTENYIKKRKFQCKERLVKSIQDDPVFQELHQDPSIR